MQTITQIPTKTKLLRFGPFGIFYEICMQINFMLFVLLQVDKSTSKKYAKFKTIKIL